MIGASRLQSVKRLKSDNHLDHKNERGNQRFLSVPRPRPKAVQRVEKTLMPQLVNRTKLVLSSSCTLANTYKEDTLPEKEPPVFL